MDDGENANRNERHESEDSEGEEQEFEVAVEDRVGVNREVRNAGDAARAENINQGPLDLRQPPGAALHRDAGDQILAAVNDLLATQLQVLRRDTDTRFQLLGQPRPHPIQPHQAPIAPPYQAPRVEGERAGRAQAIPALYDSERADEPSRDLQADYTALRDALTHVQLPSHLRLNDSRSGIQREDQATYNNLARSARYVETTIKLLHSLHSPGDINQAFLDNLSIIWPISIISGTSIVPSSSRGRVTGKWAVCSDVTRPV